MNQTNSNYPHFILGSASPRRRELLSELGIPFEVHTVDVDEDQITDPDPSINVLERAKLKATALLPRFGGQSLILTADTTIAFDGQLLNKPPDRAEAKTMLLALREKPHQVYTGMVLVDLDQKMHTIISATDIHMRPYSDAEIDAYIATGDPMDKAGAYAIQHPDFRPVRGLAGCYTGVMGLSICDLILLFDQIGIQAKPGWEKRFGKLQNENDQTMCEVCTSKFGRSH